MKRDFKELTALARTCAGPLAEVFKTYVRDHGVRVLWDNATVSCYMEAYHLGRKDAEEETVAAVKDVLTDVSILRDGIGDGLGDPAKFIEAHVLPKLRAMAPEPEPASEEA